MKTEIEKLAKSAANADKSEDAQRYAQAALNLAHTEATLNNLKKGDNK